jgi:gas vesicle protein
MKGDHMGKVFSIILIAAGSFAAGMLLAPKSGKETRQAIKNRMTMYKEKASDGLDEAKKGAQSVKEDVQRTVEATKKATR